MFSMNKWKDTEDRLQESSVNFFALPNMPVRDLDKIIKIFLSQRLKQALKPELWESKKQTWKFLNNKPFTE